MLVQSFEATEVHHVYNQWMHDLKLNIIYRKRESTKLLYRPSFLVCVYIYIYKCSIGHSWFLRPDSLSMCFVDQTLSRIKMAVCFKTPVASSNVDMHAEISRNRWRKRRGQTSQSYAARIATCRVVRKDKKGLDHTVLGVDDSWFVLIHLRWL